MSPDGMKKQSFALLPLEPNKTAKIRTLVHTIEYHLIQQTPGIKCVVFTGKAFWNSPLWPDQEGPASERSPSFHKRDTATFIHRCGRVDPHAVIRWPTTTKEE
jgi:hypothetical protein